MCTEQPRLGEVSGVQRLHLLVVCRCSELSAHDHVDVLKEPAGKSYVVCVRLTIMGKTTAADDALMDQRTMRQDSCTAVKMWTFHRGT